jgi:hypothetical protein
VIPALLIAVGLLALVAGIGLIASFGTRLRVGRLLAGTRSVPLSDLAQAATGSAPPYVRVDGRIDSEEDFEDAAHRPLVFRRTLVQLRRPGLGTWRTVDESREAVPFTIGDASGEVTIDPADLADGLVVMPREAAGVASDLPDRVPAGTPPQARVRVRVEQVSSVEHAIALGVPVARADGIQLRPAPNRPLILTTLEPPEAMRVLADGRQPLIRAAVVLFVIGCAATALGVVAAALRLGT